MEKNNDARDLPTGVIWDTTYACPLLCVHCYSESGRRDSKQLPPERLLAVADAIVRLHPGFVFLSGGEPLIVKGIEEVIDRLTQGGVATHVFTSGWNLDSKKVARFGPLLTGWHISLDGATAAVHDKIRQRPGSFDRVMRALQALDDASRERRAAGKPPFLFGLDCTIIRSNFEDIKALVTDVAARFPEMSYVNMGAAAPTGLASEPKFAETELLTEEQRAVMRNPETAARLCTGKLLVSTSDNRQLQMHPDDVAAGTAMMDTIQVEPDGNVRAMAIYEGTVGNLIDEPPDAIWQRAKARWADPFVVSHLGKAQTMVEWAVATRAIDEHFGEPDDLVRISKRRAG